MAGLHRANQKLYEGSRPGSTHIEPSEHILADADEWQELASAQGPLPEARPRRLHGPRCNPKAYLHSSTKDEHFPLIYTRMPHEAFPPLPGLTVPKQFSQGPWVGSHPSPCHSQLRRAEPLRKKKKVDPKKDQAVKDRLKKRIRRLEKASQELIPIEDFIIPVKFMDKVRQRPEVELSFEEAERRALLLKKWSLYKQREHEMEREAIKSMLEAQKEALQELQLTSQELYAEAIKRDYSLFPFEREGPAYTPPISNYQPPEGRYHDITKVYTQVEFKR
ncbi:39S ribosomal protein L40, mitochondrial [Myotis davidii]|uniref:Large ribosomal subunit protein mL40 n=1 Tax=Myotis davidii TaxID=225400 RepID=L5LLH6_MYODS|nr:39S ribosomal protein L40, mitochondrial [Myotis davidii]